MPPESVSAGVEVATLKVALPPVMSMEGMGAAKPPSGAKVTAPPETAMDGV